MELRRWKVRPDVRYHFRAPMIGLEARLDSEATDDDLYRALP
jgi:hypothetical protein